MSKTLPPLHRGSHLRLVPPLPEDLATGPAPGGAQTSGHRPNHRRPSAHQGLMGKSYTPPAQWPLPALAAGARWFVGAAVVLGLLGSWALHTLPEGADPGHDVRTLAKAAKLRPVNAAATQGAPAIAPTAPEMQLYVKDEAAGSLGRPLTDGDSLRPTDALIISFSNARPPGGEAAHFAAMFVMNSAKQTLPLFAAPEARPQAMPLPQVASLALLDGPKLSVTEPGPVTLWAVFLRRDVPLEPLMASLKEAAVQGTAAIAPSWPKEAQEAVLRLQGVTLHLLADGP